MQSLTGLKVAVFLFCGFVSLFALIMALEQWRKEQLEEIEQERRLLKDHLLKMGIAIEAISV
ncbi:hypothetical protein [Pedobacter sp. ASV28]|uniref:hypothetical protein n=1 Tax=Pedobacter sp. ASV28 TaxID=2795123 RepID=UPI0018EDD3AF|nr:hypothetical protein [Pedobacter sp. ASV28]